MYPQELIAAWLRMSLAKEEEHRASIPEEDFAHWMSLNLLVEQNPAEAWIYIVHIANEMDGPKQFAYLAAGPLEDLLVQIGDDCITFFKPEDTHVLEKLLPFVWLGRLSDQSARWVEANRTYSD